MRLRDPNPIMGCTIVLQIEHIDLEFNMKVFPPFSSSLPPLPAAGSPDWGDRKRGSYHNDLKENQR
jgi:hypothetical protein